MVISWLVGVWRSQCPSRRHSSTAPHRAMTRAAPKPMPSSVLPRLTYSGASQDTRRSLEPMGQTSTWRVQGPVPRAVSSTYTGSAPVAR